MQINIACDCGKTLRVRETRAWATLGRCVAMLSIIPWAVGCVLVSCPVKTPMGPQEANAFIDPPVKGAPDLAVMKQTVAETESMPRAIQIGGHPLAQGLGISGRLEPGNLLLVLLPGRRHGYSCYYDQPRRDSRAFYGHEEGWRVGGLVSASEKCS